MTAGGRTGEGASAWSRARPRFKPVVAGLSVASPVLALLLVDAATLLWAFVDPSSTCWLKAASAGSETLISPFLFNLLLFTGTLQYWGPVLLLVGLLFWYFDWIRMRELAAVAVGCVAAIYVAGFEYGWMVDLYRSQYQTACG